MKITIILKITLFFIMDEKHKDKNDAHLKSIVGRINEYIIKKNKEDMEITELFKENENDANTKTITVDMWKQKCTNFEKLLIRNKYLVEACESLRKSNDDMIEYFQKERECLAQQNSYSNEIFGQTIP